MNNKKNLTHITLSTINLIELLTFNYDIIRSPHVKHLRIDGYYTHTSNCYDPKSDADTIEKLAYVFPNVTSIELVISGPRGHRENDGLQPFIAEYKKYWKDVQYTYTQAHVPNLKVLLQ